jgi:uncharacterized protein (TIGR02001 family)
MNLRKLMLATTIIVSMGATSYMAEGISANVGFVTDYVFRGVSQTDESMAIQGGFDYEHGNGLHAGVWGSNIDFNNPQDGSLELDVYAGYANEINNFSYDVGGIYYAYPGSDSSLDYDYWEAYLALGYQFDIVGLSAGMNYSPEFFGDTGDATYVYAGLDVDLPHDFAASAHIGHQEIDEATDYTDWSVGLGYNWSDFDFDLTYTDTDLDQSDLDEGRVVFGVSKSF